MWRWIGGGCAAVVAIAASWRYRRALLKWVRETYQTPEFYEVLKTASGEIAVLLFVFPLIDRLGKSDGPASGNWQLVRGSFGIGFLFLLLAGIFANRESKERTK